MKLLHRSSFPVWLLASGLWLLFSVGCAKRDSVVARGNQEGVFHLSVGSEVADLDPHTVTGLADAKVCHALYEPLVTYNPTTFAPEPALAERWEVSADGLTYTFHLRADAKWSNGEPVTAQDCIDSWRRILTPALGADYSSLLHIIRGAEAFNAGQTKDFSTVGAKAPDARTVTVTLKHPTPYFLQILLNSPWRPLNLRSIAQHGDPYSRGTPWTRPGRLVSSGPFVLKEWVPNQRIVVEKSPTYYDRARVRLNSIHFYPTESIDADERAYRAGQLHATWALPLSKVRALQAEKSPALHIRPVLQTYFFRLNVRKPPLNDPRVRRALALSIDRDVIAGKILSGGRTPAPTFVPPLLKDYTPPTRKARDIAAARQALAEAGFPEGKGLPPLELLYDNSEILRLVSEAVQEMWRRELGIDVKLANQEKKVVYASRSAGDYQILLGDWTADYLDATTFLDMWRTGNGNNHTRWTDPAYDALCAQADRTIDSAARAALLAQAENLVLDAAPIIPVYFNTNVHYLHPSVKGYLPTPGDHTDYRHVFLQP